MSIRSNPKLWVHILSIPLIWLPALPMVIMDLCMEIYHRICFPIYGLPLVSRREYIKIDRHKLEYLQFWDKLNCTYCGYANGLLAYSAKITAETEKYWCAIKHQPGGGYVPVHHAEFADHGDEAAFRALPTRSGWKKAKNPKK